MEDPSPLIQSSAQANSWTYINFKICKMLHRWASEHSWLVKISPFRPLHMDCISIHKYISNRNTILAVKLLGNRLAKGGAGICPTKRPSTSTGEPATRSSDKGASLPEKWRTQNFGFLYWKYEIFHLLLAKMDTKLKILNLYCKNWRMGFS